jgi:hypothetical protein
MSKIKPFGMFDCISFTLLGFSIYLHAAIVKSANSGNTLLNKKNWHTAYGWKNPARAIHNKLLVS